MSTGTAPITILHVEDDADFAALAARFLERADDRFEVESVTDPDAGLDTLADRDVDCVVSDYDMPGTNGVEFLEAVRATHPELPFILYTGKGSEEVASDAISAGTSDYLQKETGTDHFEVLANRIGNLVAQRRAESRVQAYAEEAAESERYRERLLEITSDPDRSDAETIDRLLALGCERFGVENGHLVAIDEATGEHDVVSVTGSDIVREGVRDLSETFCRRTIESDGILDVHHAAEAGWDGDPAYEGSGVECYIGGKLRTDGRLYGTLCFVDREPREPFSHAEKAFFDLLVRWFDQILERRRRLKRAEAVFEHTQDGVFIVDVAHDGTFRVRSVNRAYEELTELDRSAVAGRTPTELLGADHAAQVLERYRECVAAAEPIEYEERLEISGRTRDFHTRLAPVIEDGDVVQLVGATRDVTERRYEAIFNQTYQFTGLVDPDGTLLEANDTVLEFGGLDRADVVGTKLWETPWFQHSEATRERARRAVERAAAGEFVRHELTITGADREAVIDFSVRPVTDEDGAVVLLVPEGRDVTERAEERRKRQRVIERVTDAIVEVDADWRFTLVNEQAEALYDMSEADLLGRDFWTVFEAARGTRFEEEYRRVMETREPTSFVEYFSQLDGWFDVTAYPTADGGIAFYFVEITEERERRRELEKTNALLSTLFETLPIGVLAESESRDVLAVNERLLELFDVDGTPDALLGTDCERLADAVSDQFADPDRFRWRLRAVIDAREPVDDEALTLADGRTLERGYRPIELPDGDGHLWVYRDVTDRLEHEHRLEALTQASRELLTADTREGVARVGVEVAKQVIELEANAIHLHEAGEGLVPVAVTDAVYDLVEEPPTFDGGDSIAWRVFERGEAIAVDAVGDDPDTYNPDTYIESELVFPIGDQGVLIAGSPTKDAFDQEDVLLGEILVGNIAAALQQIERTEQLRRRERELTHQNDRLDQFASIVSHDLRNPLTVAKGHLELAQETCDSTELDHVAQAHERMETLIDDLLTLAREGETMTAPEPVDLADLFEDCWRNVDTADATYRTASTQVVRADANRLKQLFENLIRNAVEHAGPEVTVTLGPLDDGFYVEDDGPGIPAAERADVFDAGYSTGETGTGFGLSIVEQIAEAHGWQIRVTDGSEGGARFEITGVTFDHDDE